MPAKPGSYKLKIPSSSVFLEPGIGGAILLAPETRKGEKEDRSQKNDPVAEFNIPSAKVGFRQDIHFGHKLDFYNNPFIA
jgi:hypothetical protein